MINLKRESLWFWLIVIAVLIMFVLLMSSCNTPKHMAKVYPKGYWMKGKYLSNHSEKRTIFAK